MPLRVVDVIFRFNYCTDLLLLAGDGDHDDDGDGEQGGGLRWSTSGSHYIITITNTMGFVNICTMMKMVVIMMI